jgi:trans-2-enoyl-CoA reductase
MSRAQLKQTARSAAECDKFNAAHPVGIEVVVARDNGEQHRGKTRSEAYISNSGDAVIFVTGISGYYLLSRVTAFDGEANE